MTTPSQDTPVSVELVARTICRATGANPDTITLGSGYISSGASELIANERLWQRFVPAATAVLALPALNARAERAEGRSGMACRAYHKTWAHSGKDLVPTWPERSP